ncbi:MAG TPA: hypothetical protein VEA69_02980 [Tepidisphaeraceae bacterium]|nr:hypothetical protein [Tepidisphaeraceae bacterium]
MADNVRLVGNLFTRLESELFGGDRLNAREFVSLMFPGLFLSTTAGEENGSTALFNQSRTLNRALDTSYVMRGLASTIDGTYGEVLEFAALPNKSSTTDQDRALEEHKTALERSDRAYKEYKRRYDRANRDWLTETNRPHPDPSAIAELYAKVEEALQDWLVFGEKEEYEYHLAQFNYLMAGNPRTYWDRRYRTPFTLAEQTSPRGKFRPAYLEPPSNSWSSPGIPWANVAFDVNDSSSTATTRSTSWSAGIGLNFGLFSFGGGGGGSSDYRHEHSETSTAHVEFEVLRVEIHRPWQDLNVFSHKFWTWKKSHGYVPLCDGGATDANPPRRPVGQLPFVTTHAYVARNIRVRANFSANDETFIRSQFNTNVSFGWGPFSASGSYSESNSEQTVTGHYEGGTLSVDHPQIIAVGGVLLPKTPDPDRTLNWPDDAAFEETMPRDARAQLLLGRAADYARARSDANARYQRAHLELARAAQDRAIDEERLQAAASYLKHEERAIEAHLDAK